MPSLMTPRAVQVTPLQLVFMNHEAPPSIAIDIQSWVRFGSGQLAKAQSERAAHQAQWEGVNFGRRCLDPLFGLCVCEVALPGRWAHVILGAGTSA